MTPPVEPRPNKDRGWTLQNFDLLDIERIARVAAEIPHPVEIKVIAGREAAKREIVALRSRLASAQADAGHIAKRLAGGGDGDVLILQQLLRDHVDGLRHIDQRFGQFVEGREIGLIARSDAALDRDRRERRG